MKALNSYRTKNRNLETGVEMEKYSVLLVDDEEDVIQIIMKKMDWESMGFQIVGYAHNGVEALEMAEELQPDVVMTDIKMPYMDGLTPSRKLKELYRTVKIIIFSGFDEFEYAKEAIQIEVEEYILKPIDARNLKEVFGRIHEKIGREMDEKRNVDKLREYYMESLPILQENFYTSLIDGRIPEGEVEKYLSNYQIDLTGPCYVVSILHILDGKTSKNTISTSVLCDQTDSGFHGICRMFDIYFFTFNINLSGLDRSHSENAFQKLCSLSSYQTTKSENLTFAECERYILE